MLGYNMSRPSLGILIIFVVLIQNVLADGSIRIGAVFYPGSDDMQVSLNMTARSYNFDTSVKIISKKGEFLEIYKNVCSLTEEGVIAIIDGLGGRASEAVQAVCDMVEIPHVVLQHNDLYTPDWSILDLFPSSSAYSNLLESLIRHKHWDNYTIFYIKGYSINRENNLLKIENDTDRNIVTLRELSGLNYRDVLISAKESGFTNFVVDCPSEKLRQFLMHAQQVGLMSDEHSYIFLSPDLFTLDLSDYRYGGVNITGFRLIDLKSNENIWQFTSNFNDETGQSKLPEEIKSEVMLIHDAVNVIASAWSKLINATPQAISCVNYEAWVYGSTLLNFMRTNKLDGLTRELKFDGTGQRSDITLEILELTPSGNQTIGLWDDNILKISRPLVTSADITEELVMRNKTFKVLIAMTPPYGYIKESAIQLEGNDRYEGFAVDLFERLSEILGFSYELIKENNYGRIDPASGKWNGMVREIQDEKADFAICDFTITAQRQSAVEFSTPFMTLGIGILYKEPSKQPPEMFSFMAVFSKEVWLYMLFSQIGLGIILIFVGRISHKEWQNPVPCIEQPEELSNQFSFSNSIWLIIGSVMQQGTEIAPIALAPRLITSVWWFFTMVMVASYTGTLVAFLTVEKNVLPFETPQALYEQSLIHYGAKKSGSTIQFFKESKNPVYQGMYKKMVDKGWLVEDNDLAVEKAENSQYAAFMESTTIEYYKERHCDLLQVGQLLDTKSYGIGMKKMSEYKKYIDQALLHLKETGVIQKLKDTWWKEKRGGGKCEKVKNAETKQLDMKNMIGAFVVLGMGCLIGILISILDMLWGVFKKSVKYNTTFREELIDELKFAIKFSGDVKPVKRRPDKGSTEALSTADEEARDEVRSIRSVRSSGTHRTHHSHSSRHSSRCQSVAFARMRKYS